MNRQASIRLFLASWDVTAKNSMVWSAAGMIFDPRLTQTGVILRYAGKQFQ